MTLYGRSISRFMASEEGPTAVEYAVMLAMIIIVCLIAIQAMGVSTAGVFTDMANKMPTGS
jgi:pilus assembly protein Flp/PilA